MPIICETCNREYTFPSCEFCARENQWNLHGENIVFRNYLPPRLGNETKNLRSEKMDAYVEQLAEEVWNSDGQGLYVWNNRTRTGKTVLAAMVFVALLKLATIYNTSKSAKFTSMLDVLEEEQQYKINRFDNHRYDIVPFEYYTTVKYLVLDDFGVEGIKNDVMYNFMYRLINHRYEHMLPTIFTSNCSLEDLTVKLDDARISSRLGRMSLHTIKFDYREV
jgi:DNA replication protein DnaC